METTQKLCFIALLFTGILSNISATVFIFQNNCNETIWPGALSYNNIYGPEAPSGGGFELPPGATNQFAASRGWVGMFFARTECVYVDGNNFHCTTGNCGGFITPQCNSHRYSYGTPPSSMARFTLGGGPTAPDFYDVSVNHGYNVGMSVRPSGGTGDCQNLSCVADLNKNCPADLRVVNGDGKLVGCHNPIEVCDSNYVCCPPDMRKMDGGCRSTCEVLDLPDSCCSSGHHAGQHETDDGTTTTTCADSDYVITFCPTD